VLPLLLFRQAKASLWQRINAFLASRVAPRWSRAWWLPLSSDRVVKAGSRSIGGVRSSRDN
jgi:hypothetical protein